jgi:spore coat protein CotH
MKRALPLILILLSASAITRSQPSFPDNGQLYVDTVVPAVYIEIHPDTLAWIYANPDSDKEFRAVFVFDNGSVRDTVEQVGFRLRGNTSRNSKKKSFKVSFNTFIPGGKYHGVEKMNLNGEHNDPSVMRSKLMWDILRRWNIPAPRANHVRVHINGSYFGLYINVEHIDEEFALS